MKFNQPKWEALQRRKEELHQIYRHAQDNLDHVQQNYGRALSYFSTGYRECRTALEVIQQDAKTLNASAIDAKLNRLRREWPTACDEFNVGDGFDGKHALIELYALMLERRKLTDARDQAAQNQTAYGACFARLNEFAAQHGKGDPTRFDAAPVPEPAYPGTYEVYEGY
jgi:hypothetical protein